LDVLLVFFVAVFSYRDGKDKVDSGQYFYNILILNMLRSCTLLPQRKYRPERTIGIGVAFKKSSIHWLDQLTGGIAVAVEGAASTQLIDPRGICVASGCKAF
jgi:hypothetical protein